MAPNSSHASSEIDKFSHKTMNFYFQTNVQVGFFSKINVYSVPSKLCRQRKMLKICKVRSTIIWHQDPPKVVTLSDDVAIF